MNTKEFEEELNLCLKKIYKESDLDWIEIVETLGLNCSPDHLRKKAYGYKEYHEYIKTKGIDSISEDMYNKMLEKEIKIKKLTTKLSDMRVLVNKETREQSRYENLLELLRENIVKFDGLDTFDKKDEYIYNENGMKECIVLLSDIHYGLEVENNWNKYNSDIAKDRMSKVIGKSIKLGTLNDCKIVHLVVTGDFVNNNIHLTSRLSNRESITKQVVGVSKLISDAIKELSVNFEFVCVHLVSGNHDRILLSKKDNAYEDFYVNIIKDYIMVKTENLNNVIFDENTDGHDICVFNSCGKKIVAIHGDTIPLKQVLPRLNTMYGNVDYVLRGHVHKDDLESFGRGKVITCPSFSGMDKYAQQLGFNSRPEQKIIILEKDSNDELIYNVDLSEIRG